MHVSVLSVLISTTVKTIVRLILLHPVLSTLFFCFLFLLNSQNNDLYERLVIATVLFFF